MKLYYFDTSIWLDFFEARNEPNFPKGKFAKELIEKIIREGDKIIVSDNNLLELNVLGYSEFDLNILLDFIRDYLVFVESDEKQIGKAKDLSLKRNVPQRDALHAILARDNNSILITFDNHFKLLDDITKPNTPKDFI